MFQEAIIPFIYQSNSPKFLVLSGKNQSNSTIVAIDVMSLQIQIPSRTATFRIYSSDGTLFYISSNFDYRILPNNTVQMKLNGNTKFQEKGSYYVILGPGFTKSSTKCGVESQAVMNSDQWKFTISKSRYFSIPMFKKC